MSEGIRGEVRKREEVSKVLNEMNKTNFAPMDKTVDNAPMKKVEFPETYKNLTDIDHTTDPALRRMMDAAVQEAFDGRR